jgi:predicted permease
MSIFLYILFKNILPLVFIILIGFILSKKFDLNIQTLTKINFYIYVPAFIFVQIYTTEMPNDTIKVLIFVFLFAIMNSISAEIISYIRKYESGLKNAFVNSIIFYNSGNIGIPLITLVFSSGPFLINGQTPYLTVALTTQIIVLVVQNISTNTIGFLNAGKGTMSFKSSIKGILKMPTIYAVPAAFILKAIPYDLREFPLWPSFTYLKDGLISMALVILGAQLSKTEFSLKNKEVYISNFIRLIGGPIFAFIIIKILGITGIPAQALMISSSMPTAVNTALIAVERNNHPDFASQAVMTATLLSAITITVVVYISRVIFII